MYNLNLVDSLVINSTFEWEGFSESQKGRIIPEDSYQHFLNMTFFTFHIKVNDITGANYGIVSISTIGQVF